MPQTITRQNLMALERLRLEVHQTKQQGVQADANLADLWRRIHAGRKALAGRRAELQSATDQVCTS